MTSDSSWESITLLCNKALDIGANRQSASSPARDAEPTVPADASPALSESAKLRSALMSALRDHISRAHLNQTQAAKVFGVTQPRISDLTRGKVDLFGLDALVNMAAAAGLRVEMRVGAADRPIELR